MFLKGLLTVTALGAVTVLSANFVLGLTDSHVVNNLGKRLSSLLIAPVSLGNSTTVVTRVTRPPENLDNHKTNLQNHRYDFSVKLSRGETLNDMLSRIGVSRRESVNAIRSFRKAFNPSRLLQGQEIRFTFQTNAKNLLSSKLVTLGDFLELSMSPDFAHVVVVKKKANNEFKASFNKRHLTTQLVRSANTINRSLFMAGKKVKVPNSVLSELIRLYSWDVDFQREIRSGDRFELMYKQYYDTKGKLVHNGDIMYGLLDLSGKELAIFRYVSAAGEVEYFDEKGQSIKKELMRTPIDGARLSSGFGRRKHPILGYTKMHKGIDFAAPRGTPIYAAGKGVIQYAGRKGAYGNFVLIRHNTTYSTAYAHMKSIKTAKGRRVQQGQIIGYVGSTGRSTGPHLHYEIRRSGRQVNPLKVKLPSGRKLKGDELRNFHTTRKKIEEQYAVLPRQLNIVLQ